MTANPQARIAAHHTGKGASATRNNAPESVTFHAHASKKAAKAAETRLYYKAHGDKVRGAGNTKAFD
jgi:predicted GIY-YIG superfamily endonuclease